MKQTAVEWLLNEFQEAHKDFGGLDLQWLNKFEQAKEMEKQQVVEAFDIGYANAIHRVVQERENTIQYGEQYYNETFKKK